MWHQMGCSTRPRGSRLSLEVGFASANAASACVIPDRTSNEPMHGLALPLQTFKAQPISPLRGYEGKPKGFTPVQCTSVERAVFTRIDSISFTGALMLGEEP